MKKLLVILLLLVSGLSFSQEKKKTLDERINTKLDSLSKVYKQKVVGYGWFSYRGVKETVIYYIKDGKEIKKVIKTEIDSRAVKETE